MAVDLAMRDGREADRRALDDAKHRALAEQFVRACRARRTAAPVARRPEPERRALFRNRHGSLHRHRRAAQRGQVHPLQRALRRAARRRRTTRSAPSSRTWAWCRCRTSGWTSSSALVKPQKKIPTSLEFVDIAGLVRGASKGEGLGNQFLANIRQVDAVLHVLRCFEDDNVTHVEGGVDPVRDRDVVDTELCLKDLETVEKRRERAQRNAKAGGKAGDEAKAELALLDRVKAGLDAGVTVRAQKLSAEEHAAAPRAVPADGQAGAVRGEHRRGADGQGGRGPAREARCSEMAAKEGAEVVVLAAAHGGGDPAAARGGASGLPGERGADGAGPAQGGARGLQAAGPADLLHGGRAGVPRLDHPQGLQGAAGGRRHPHGLRARLHQGRGDALGGPDQAGQRGRGAARRGCCGWRARSTSSRTATACTSASTCNVSGRRNRRSPSCGISGLSTTSRERTRGGAPWAGSAGAIRSLARRTYRQGEPISRRQLGPDGHFQPVGTGQSMPVRRAVVDRPLHPGARVPTPGRVRGCGPPLSGLQECGVPDADVCRRSRLCQELAFNLTRTGWPRPACLADRRPSTCPNVRGPPDPSAGCADRARTGRGRAVQSAARWRSPKRPG